MLIKYYICISFTKNDSLKNNIDPNKIVASEEDYLYNRESQIPNAEMGFLQQFQYIKMR